MTKLRALWIYALAALIGCTDGDSEPDGSAGSDASMDADASTDASASTDGDARMPTDDGGGERELALRFEEVALEKSPEQVTNFRFIPGTQELLVLSKSGTVRHYELEQERAKLLGSFEVPGTHDSLDCGLISLAFDPAFEDNHRIYLGLCFSEKDTGIVRMTFTPDDYDAIAGSSVEIHRASEPDANRPWHNIGQMGFDADGNLWALYGEKTVSKNSQDLSNDLGSLVRLRPGREPDEGGFEPAEPPNPFADSSERSHEVYAYGLRSPWTGLLDSHGHYVIGDVGGGDFEEINVVTAPGQNFGWPDAEGSCAEDCDDFVNPVREWAHESSHAFVLDDPSASATTERVGWVGVEYLPEGENRYDGLLDGKILYGDMCVGFVRAMQLDDEGELVSDAHVGHLRGASAWARGPDGYVYAVTYGSCTSDDDPEPGGLVRAVLEE